MASKRLLVSILMVLAMHGPGRPAAAVVTPDLEYDHCGAVLALLSHLRENPKYLVDALTVSSSDIDFTYRARRLNPLGRGDTGMMNSGVFRVRLKDGRYVAIKLSSQRAFDQPLDGAIVRFNGTNTTHPPFRDYVVIHRMLGELGHVPMFYGFLLGPEGALTGAALRRQRLAVDPIPVVGILMEEIEKPWNIVRADSTPAFVRSWDVNTMTTLLERMKTMERDLNRLGITAGDIQFFVTHPAGGVPRILLGDVDGFLFRGPTNSPNSFRQEMDDLVFRWERASGQTLPDRTFRDATGYDRIPPP